jgi:hypothetical protein
MQGKIEIDSNVVDGKPKKNLKLINDCIKSFEGNDITITVEKKKRKRSNNQSRYYWGIIIPLVRVGLKDTQGISYSKEEVHEFLKANFNFSEIINEHKNQILRVPLSTTEITTIQAEEYYESIRNFADTFLGVLIPLPNDDFFIE